MPSLKKYETFKLNVEEVAKEAFNQGSRSEYPAKVNSVIYNDAETGFCNLIVAVYIRLVKKRVKILKSLTVSPLKIIF